MKIVQINAVYEYSSTGRMVKQMHEFFQSKGLESYVFACNLKDEEIPGVYHFNGKISAVVHAIMSRLTGRQGFFSYCSTKRLVKKLEKIKPDVVHLHNLHSNCINLSVLVDYLAKNDIPTILTLHDCWYFTGHCCYFTDSKCERWKYQCGNCPDQKLWNKSLIFDASPQNLKAKKKLFAKIPRLGVIGVSNWVSSFIKDSILKDAKLVTYVHNWIDTDLFTPKNPNSIREQYNLQDEFVVLGVAQGWNEPKGILDFKKVAEMLPEYKFLMVGEMPDVYKPLPENMISAGVVNNVELLTEYYSAADVFLNLSTRETFGLVTVEAQSCGTPVVAYRLTATPELITEKTGIVVEYKNWEAIKQALYDIKQKGKFNISGDCRQNAVENFNKSNLIKKYLDQYKKLITQ